MNINWNEISQAIVLYIGYGVSLSPINDRNKITDTFGMQKTEELVNKVILIIEEANQVSIDWSQMDLATAGKVVWTAMHNRYPDIEIQALDAIAWKFTFDWR
jgi:hypothetical protein